MDKVEVSFSDVSPGVISYVAIGVRHDNKWLFIKHRERGGYEIPAGHPEEGETPENAAIRELMEETGAEDFIVTPVSYYSVKNEDETMHGKLFYSEVIRFGDITDKDEVESLFFSEEIPEEVSLPQVMRALFAKLTDFII